jgi:uncharacterized membrane protein
MTATTPPVREDFGLERLNALSDGVFAIILTLLVLELKLPDLAAGDTVPQALAENSHVFVAWLISFLAIARFWVVHHRITASLQRCSTGTLALNFAVLGAASLMPFTADTLGNAQIAEPWSTVIFAANFALVSLALGLLARHAATEVRLLRPEGAPTVLASYRRHHLVVLPLVSLGAAVLAFAHPYLAVALLALEFLVAVWAGLRRRPAGPGPRPAPAWLRRVGRPSQA